VERMQGRGRDEATNTGTTRPWRCILLEGGRNCRDAFRGPGGGGCPGRLRLDQVSPKWTLHRHLYTAHTPDPDFADPDVGRDAGVKFSAVAVAYTEILSRIACGQTSAGSICWRRLRTTSAGERRTAG